MSNENIVTFPKPPTDDGERIIEAGPVDLAQVLYTMLSAIDLAETTPEIFWSIFRDAKTKGWHEAIARQHA